MQKAYGDGRAAKQQVRKYWKLVADLHTGGLVLYGRFPQEWSSMGNSAAELSDWANLLRMALLTPLSMGKRLEKVP